MDYLDNAAQTHFQIPFLFPYQKLVVTGIVENWEITEDTDRIKYRIIVLPTGAGKSLCFMLPGFLCEGITLIIYPLLSLMKDQLRRFEETGAGAVMFRGGQSKEERKLSLSRLATGNARFIITNPETIYQSSLSTDLLKLPIKHIVLDEAHILPQWGETFRTAYMELGRLCSDFPHSLISAFTATATVEIKKKIEHILFDDQPAYLIEDVPDRPNISYVFTPVMHKRQAVIQLLKREQMIYPVQEPAIVFCRTRRQSEQMALELRWYLKRDDVRFYHAGLSAEEKKCIEDWFYSSEKGVLVSTCAYGMGVDKKNIKTVIHSYLPDSVESFLQESGRAGRDREPAVSFTLYTREDLESNPESRMVQIAGNSRQCRREAMLACMGNSIDFCSGCDVCETKACDTPVLEKSLNTVLKKIDTIMTCSEGVYLLKGINPPSFRHVLWNLLPGRALLCSWPPDHIEDLLRSLEKRNLVRFRKNG